jgi:hypothetical protein
MTGINFNLESWGVIGPRSRLVYLRDGKGDIVKSFYDTGSSISLITYNYVKSKGLRIHPLPAHVHFHSISGDTLKFLAVIDGPLPEGATMLIGNYDVDNAKLCVVDSASGVRLVAIDTFWVLLTYSTLI